MYRTELFAVVAVCMLQMLGKRHGQKPCLSRDSGHDYQGMLRMMDTGIMPSATMARRVTVEVGRVTIRKVIDIEVCRFIGMLEGREPMRFHRAA